MAASVDETYYIGQGKCYWAPRQANGPIIGGYQFFGDTQQMQVTSAQKTVEVEENTTGFGGIALHAPVSVPLKFKLQLPILSMRNLALGLFSAYSGKNAGGTVTNESTTAYADGGFTKMANFGLTGSPTLASATGIVTAVTIGTPGTGYTTGDPVIFTSAPAGGVTATGTVIASAGAITGILLSDAGLGYTVAPTVTIGGSGTGGAVTSVITSKTLAPGTDFTYDATNGNYSPIIGGSSWFQSTLFSPTCPIRLTAGYSYAENNGSVNMLSAPSPEISLMFNGLNVASPNGSTFNAVPVLIKRTKLDFTKMLDLIAKKEAILELDGAILYDHTATDGVYYGTFSKA